VMVGCSCPGGFRLQGLVFRAPSR